MLASVAENISARGHVLESSHRTVLRGQKVLHSIHRVVRVGHDTCTEEDITPPEDRYR